MKGDEPISLSLNREKLEILSEALSRMRVANYGQSVKLPEGFDEVESEISEILNGYRWPE